jgi:NADH-quinone oxidoreductase subunit J
VITLLGAEQLPGYEPIKGHRITALILALIFVAEIVMFTVVRNQVVIQLTDLSADFASPKAIGISLFTDYLLPFEMVAFILLSATIGAIVLTKPDKSTGFDLSRREP